MDYTGEQAMELEALQAIFMDDLLEYEGSNPDGWSRHATTYLLAVKPADEGDDTEGDGTPGLAMELLWAHTPQYPEVGPSFRLRAVSGLSDADIAVATTVLQQEVDNNLGMAMVYNLHQAAQAWLTERASAAGAPRALDPEEERRRAAEAEEAARAAARAHGTPVTVAAFMEWRTRWDAQEAARRSAAAGASGIKDSGAGGAAPRLSGKQYFMRQAAAGAAAEDDGSAISEGSDADGLSDYEPGREREDEEDVDYDEDDDGDDEDDFLEEYMADKQGKGS